MRAVLLGRGQRQYRDPARRIRFGNVRPADRGPVAGRGHQARHFFAWICRVQGPASPYHGQNDRRSPIMSLSLLLRALTAGLAVGAAFPAPAPTLDKGSFRPHRVAEAEDGGGFLGPGGGAPQSPRPPGPPPAGGRPV